jgi:hypothetical protein
MAEKTVVNYTEEQTSQLCELYGAGKSVDEISSIMGKKPASLIAKLSRLGIYKPKEYKTKRGEPVAKKSDLTDQIALFLPEQSAEQLESLSRSNKETLKAILKVLSELSEFKRLAVEQFQTVSE